RCGRHGGLFVLSLGMYQPDACIPKRNHAFADGALAACGYCAVLLHKEDRRPCATLSRARAAVRDCTGSQALDCLECAGDEPSGAGTAHFWIGRRELLVSAHVTGGSNTLRRDRMSVSNTGWRIRDTAQSRAGRRVA